MEVLQLALPADGSLKVSSPALLEPRRGGLGRGLVLELLLELCRGLLLLLLLLEQSRSLMLELYRRLVKETSRRLVLKLSRGRLQRMNDCLSGLGDYRLSGQRGSLLLGGRGSSHLFYRRGRGKVHLILVLGDHVVAQHDSIWGRVATNCAFNRSHSFEQFTKLGLQGTYGIISFS